MSDAARAVVVPLGSGRYLVDDGSSRRVAFAAIGRDTWVFLDGRVFVVARDEAAPRRRGADSTASLRAPMPATVLAIHASAGQVVERGTLLMVLEAMKMELPIKAPRDGRIKAVACQEGELVQSGAVLLEFADESE